MSSNGDRHAIRDPRRPVSDDINSISLWTSPCARRRSARKPPGDAHLGQAERPQGAAGQVAGQSPVGSEADMRHLLLGSRDPGH
ncbi:hypothetical protein DKT69_11505 [Micromonospora sicca]|uniref:Uncharacterized protein n=1 Tax=Micromonospora sicca TaxID=2202420 RepID=A0A317DM14_9ACTN|nr:hypothetical protein DKT69_11505 [Micromonospora sp. 4G51]